MNHSTKRKLPDWAESNPKGAKVMRVNPSTLLCKTCGKMHPTATALAAHEATHTNLDLECKTCGKAFRHAATFLHHQKTHEEAKATEFVCKFCDKVFTNAHKFQCHTLTHRFTCFECRKTFKNINGLLGHAVVHLPATLPCAFCPKMYRQQGDLDRHVRTHNAPWFPAAS
ncbi:Hypothetical protein POVN_LOCUS677 [uncultured virus]|nr:Hypothetical protein POVN_LOCUS677 [uncultured virus]